MSLSAIAPTVSVSGPQVISVPLAAISITAYAPTVVSTQTGQEIVPYLIGDQESAARMRIASIYGVASVTGTTGTVTLQSPDAFTVVARGATISITLGGAINASRSRRGLPPYNNGVA
jgi:hypothetical protein